MFEWDQNDPNLQVDAEIVELQTVFRDGYHFEVKRVKMGSDSPGGDVHLAILQTYSRDVERSVTLDNLLHRSWGGDMVEWAHSLRDEMGKVGNDLPCVTFIPS